MYRYEKGITIFTPTYNRADKLGRLYKSLLAQTCKDFEWLVVDDGSADNTKELINDFINDKQINIRYYYKQNGGKHTAFNMGVKNAKKEYFLCIDSDDYMTENAVDDILQCFREYKPQGIIAYKMEKDKGIIGDQFPENLAYCTLFDLSAKYSCGGDKELIHRTEILEEIHFPEPKGVKFFPECYIYDLLDRRYESFLLRKSVCVCEYMEDGYSANYRKLLIENALSMKIMYSERIDMPCTIKQRFGFAFRHDAFSMLAKSKEGKYRGKHKLMLIIAYPFGLLMYIFYIIYKKFKV